MIILGNLKMSEFENGRGDLKISGIRNIGNFEISGIKKYREFENIGNMIILGNLKMSEFENGGGI